MTKIELRNWQHDALTLATSVFKTKKLFLTHATPGGGKTIHGLSVFDEMNNTGMVSHVVVLAPSTTLVKQWQTDAKRFYNLELKNSMLYQGMPDFHEYNGMVITYQGMNEIHESLRLFCQYNNVLVIADEIHHVADGQSWGESFRNAFELSKNILALTGTPWASNGKRISYIEYNDDGYAKPDFSYDKKTAIRDSVCRITEFYRKKATDLVFVETDSGVIAGKYTSLQEAIDDEMKGAYRKTLQSLKHFVSIFEDADIELSRLRRNGVPDAGGLIVAPDIATAHKFQDELYSLTGQEYPIAHSKLPKPHEIISNFRDSSDRWLISVDMVTEGVDIKRLQVCVFLSIKNTELYLRQVIGRIERVRNKNNLIDQNGSFYYTDIPEINEIVDRLESENKAGLQLRDEQIELGPAIPGNERKIIDDLIVLEEVTTAQNGLSANGYNFDHDIVVKALKKRIESPKLLGDFPLFILCRVVQSEIESDAEIDATEYQNNRNVPLTEKKERIRSRIAKEVTRKLFVFLKRHPTGDEIKKAHSRINKTSGITKTDDSVSYELFEKKLDTVTTSGVESWLY